METAIELCSQIDGLTQKIERKEKKLGESTGKNRAPLKIENSIEKKQIDTLMRAVATQIGNELRTFTEKLYVKAFVSNRSGYLRGNPLISISTKNKLTLSEKEMYILISFASDEVNIIYTAGYQKLQQENKLSIDDVRLLLRQAVGHYLENSGIKPGHGFIHEKTGIDILRKKLRPDQSTLIADIKHIVRIYLNSRKNNQSVYHYVSTLPSVSSGEYVNRGGTDVRVNGTRRKGHDRFRKVLLDSLKECCVTGCRETSILRASHIKPWALCSSMEKTDPANGLLLTPNYDELFDRFLISFDRAGKILISNILQDDDLDKMAINKHARITLQRGQADYMKYHRDRFYGRTV